jgi:hypothetical protein
MLMKYVIAIALLMHGIGHVLFVANSWGMWKADTGHSWLFSGVLRIGQTVEGLFGLLWLLPLVGFVIGTWGYFTTQPGWQGMLIGSAILSSVMIVLWWSGINTSSAFFALVFNLVVVGVLLWTRGAATTPLGS